MTGLGFSSRVASVFLMALVGLGLLAAASVTAADPSVSVQVGALVCLRDPGSEPMLFSTPPDQCYLQPGVVMYAHGLTNPSDSGECVTTQTGWCSISLASEIGVLLEYEPLLPSGFASPSNSRVINTRDPGGKWILNVPVEQLTFEYVASGTLTIHTRICPVDFMGPDYYAQCDPHLPTFPERIYLQGPGGDPLYEQTQTMDSTGSFHFPSVQSGETTIVIDLPFGVTNLWTYCSYDWDPGRPAPIETRLRTLNVPGNGSISVIRLHESDNILCDFYAIPTT